MRLVFRCGALRRRLVEQGGGVGAAVVEEVGIPEVMARGLWRNRTGRQNKDRQTPAGKSIEGIPGFPTHSVTGSGDVRRQQPHSSPVQE